MSNSERARREHEAAGYRARRWEVLPNGFDLDVFRPDPAARAQVRADLGVVEGAPVVGMVARLDPAKDHATFVRAAALFRERTPAAQFVLVGEGDWAPVRSHVAQAGLSDAVHILGYQAHVERLIPAFDIGTLSSTSEGFPNALGEVMAVGVPPVGDARRGRAPARRGGGGRRSTR